MMKTRDHNRELMNVIDTMDRQDNDSDVDDTDEGTNVNIIAPSMTKKEHKNHYVKNRKMDSMGIKFETNKRVNGVKGVAYQENNNYNMIDVRSKVTRKKHEIWDVWCAEWFDLIKEGKEEKHLQIWRPFVPSKELLDGDEENSANNLPYVNEKIFKVSKAITQHLSEILKTNAGIFDETVEIRFLRNLRQKTEDIEK